MQCIRKCRNILLSLQLVMTWKHIMVMNNIWNKLLTTLDNREKSIFDKQRLRVFFFYTLLMEIATFIGGIRVLLQGQNCIAVLLAFYFVFLLIPVLLYTSCNWPVRKAVHFIMFASQAVISIQMIYLAIQVKWDDVHYMLTYSGYYIPLFLNITLSIVAFEKRLVGILCFLSIVLTMSCAFIMKDDMLLSGTCFLEVLFLLLGIMGYSMVEHSYRQEEENRKLHENEEHLFALFKIKEEQLKAYMEMSQKELKDNEPLLLFDKFDHETKKNLVNNVQRYLLEKQVREFSLADRLPDLSSSEIEVVRLILLGKKQGEICRLLGKSTSNVTSTRAHIRKKIGLKVGDDLESALKNILQID